MTNREREQIIDIAIRDYNNAISNPSTNRKQKIAFAINMMENAFIMCSIWNVKGIEELRQTIIKANARFTK